MKLSFRYFVTAYLIVLLSTGIGGILLIRQTQNTLWNTRVQQVNVAETYAADSLLSFADISPAQPSAAQLKSLEHQIGNSLDSIISDVKILTLSEADDDQAALAQNAGFTRYVRTDGKLLLESTCRLNTGRDVCFISVFSDFTELAHRCDLLWHTYGWIVLLLSTVSGLILFFLTRRITDPLNRLSRTAQTIAAGDYGETLRIDNPNAEIVTLVNSFNTMSVTVAQKMREIESEIERRNTFVADFTHELKTPMTAIVGYAQLLKTYALDSEERTKAVETICHEGKRLEQLSEQLLQLYLYRNEEIVTGPLALSSLALRLDATLLFLSEKYGIPFSVSFPETTVCGNEALLLSLLYNLTDNAMKATRNGRPVLIFAEDGDGTVLFTVKDEGCGIEKEHLAHLTEPFYRVDKARSRKLGGAGLGLSLCREIAAAHRTELCFDSTPGKGTAVSFRIAKGGRDDEA